MNLYTLLMDCKCDWSFKSSNEGKRCVWGYSSHQLCVCLCVCVFWMSTVEGMRKSCVLLNLPACSPRAFYYEQCSLLARVHRYLGSVRDGRENRAALRTSCTGANHGSETWFMPQCLFLYLFHMRLLMHGTQGHRGNFHIFSFKLSEFLTQWGISLSLLLIESRGITGGHWGIMGNSSALLALPWQSRPGPASLPEESAAIDYWFGLWQRTNVRERLQAVSVCI